MKKGLKITLLVFMYAVLGILMVFNLFGVINKLCNNNLPNYFGYSFLCMEDDSSFFIEGGELIIVKRVPADSLKEDELLVFNFSGEMAISNVKYVLDGGDETFGGEEVNGGGYITYAKIYDSETGSYSEVVNASVAYKDVYGKVVGNIPALGNVLAYFTSWEFNILLLTIYIVIIWASILLINIKIGVIEDREERRKAVEKLLEENKLKDGGNKSNIAG